MSRTVAVLVSLLIIATTILAQKKAELKSQKQKASYGIGLSIGKDFREQFPEVDIDAMVAGFKDALSGTKPVLDEKQLGEVMKAFQEDMMAKRAQRMAEVGTKNKNEGDTFLAANKKKPDVITLASGLQYKILKVGSGPKPAKTDTVTCNYRGTLIDGKEFDSSYKYGKPSEFPVGRVIPGWVEALQLMPVGSQWELYIPANLAYGERGNGGDIGPNATLIFQLELLGKH
jgi:FKBP-type peptidyl-prolyl cis-trans isomerase FklB